MSSPVIAVRPTDTVAHAKNLMLRHKLKDLVVVDRGAPLRMLAMSDIAGRLGRGSATWRRRLVDYTPVARLMRKEAVTVSTGTDLKKAAALMLKHNVRSLVVKDKGKCDWVVDKNRSGGEFRQISGWPGQSQGSDEFQSSDRGPHALAGARS